MSDSQRSSDRTTVSFTDSVTLPPKPIKMGVLMRRYNDPNIWIPGTEYIKNLYDGANATIVLGKEPPADLRVGDGPDEYGHWSVDADKFVKYQNERFDHVKEENDKTRHTYIEMLREECVKVMKYSDIDKVPKFFGSWPTYEEFEKMFEFERFEKIPGDAKIYWDVNGPYITPDSMLRVIQAEIIESEEKLTDEQRKFMHKFYGHPFPCGMFADINAALHSQKSRSDVEDNSLHSFQKTDKTQDSIVDRTHSEK